jgi:squalene-hopene/tetraprenyl-beta-curcumene cyclase
MITRHVCFVSMVLGILGCVSRAPALGGENAPEQWNKAGASQYLDRRGAEWFKFSSARRGKGASETSCVSCHSLLPFALARPVLRRISEDKAQTEMETKVLEQVKTRVAGWEKLDTEPFQLYYDFEDAKKKQSRGTEAILNALALSLDDRFAGLRKPSSHSEKALSILWATQITEGQQKGSWEWLNFGLEPWESEGGRYLGAALAAIAVGTARENGYSAPDADSKERLKALGEFLTKNYESQNLHNRAWMLWASSKMDGLLSREQRDKLFAAILAKQQPDGGWSLGSLGDIVRKEAKYDVKKSDGYATGLVLHAVQVAGFSKENPQVSKGLSWLRSNQDPSGAWRAASVNKHRAPESTDPGKANIGKFMWDAATAYSVLALSD